MAEEPPVGSSKGESATSKGAPTGKESSLDPAKEKAKPKDAAADKTKPKAEAKESQTPKPAPKKEPLKPVRISNTRYVENLEGMDEKRTSKGGVDLKVSVIYDAYRYYMAQGLAELESAGFQGAAFETRAIQLHKKQKKFKNRVLFRATISAGSGNSRIILSRSIEKHIALKQKSEKTLSVSRTKPKPIFEQWKVFEYPFAGGVKRTRPMLCVTDRVEVEAFSSSVKIRDPEPIQFSLVGIAAQSVGKDPQSSLNVAERQLSLRRWEDITPRDAVVVFTPGRWRIPAPPKGFEELLRQLESIE